MADERVDALFALRPEDFTAARNDLVRQLRAGGERDRAKEVAALRRPTVAAWAVNQAVRADREAFAALRDSGRELRRAQRRALSGVAESGLREASRERRRHIERLAGRAADLLADAGGDPGPHRDDIVATFDAASATDEAGEEVGAARLLRPLAAPSAFDDLAALSVVPAEPGAADGDVVGEAERSDTPEPDAAAEQQQAAADAAAEQRRAAADAVAVARQRAEEAASARQRAHEAADSARREVEEATREAEEAVAAAERARREADRRQRRADTARGAARQRSDEAAQADSVAEDRARELEEAEERLRALPE